MIVVPRATMRNILATAVASGGLLAGATVRLYKNDLTPNLALSLADLSQADFGSYAPATITWGLPFNTTTGASVQGVSHQFTNSGPDEQIVYGYYVLSADAARVILAERFASPINLAPDDAVIVGPVYALGQ